MAVGGSQSWQPLTLPGTQDGEMPLVSLEHYQPLPAEAGQYSAAFIQNNEAIVLNQDENSILIGVVDAADSELRLRIESYHAVQHPGRKTRFSRVERNELLLYLGKRNRGESSTAGFGDSGSDDGVYLDRIANDAPVVNLVNSLILQAFNEGASDIHLDAAAEALLVRFRVDGVLRLVETLGRELRTAVSSRIKVMAQLNIMERRLPQDGRCSVTVSGRSFDLRVSILPSIHGESVVLRLLHKDGDVGGLTSLGFDADDLLRLERLLTQPHGLFLATGPTGSGKTTSLHGMIRTLPSRELKIITLEDPVEYQIDGITQVQINEDIGLGFETTLRRVLRQDPDVIMVGEIRDHATASLAVRAALTGHLVLSSLHTNSAIESVTRLVDLGVEPYLLAAVLRGALGQRLVRRLCPHCRTPMSPSKEKDLNLDAVGVPKAARATIMEPAGCDQCRDSGYQGRGLVYELLVPDEEFKDAIANRRIAAMIHRGPDIKGFRPMPQHATQLLVSGTTSLDEIRRVFFA